MVFNFVLHNLNKAPSGGGGTYDYIGLFCVPVNANYMITSELVLNYPGGSIEHNSTEEFNNDYANITLYHPNFSRNDQSDKTVLFNGAAGSFTVPGFTFAGGVPLNGKMMMSFALSTSIPQITSGKFWTDTQDIYEFSTIDVYGSNTNPAVMSNVQDVSANGEWTHFASLTKMN